MNYWCFFVLQAVVGNLRASGNLESISLSRGGDNKKMSISCLTVHGANCHLH